MLATVSLSEAISNYETVLQKLEANNLKLSPGKVRIFSSDTEIYGYRVRDGRNRTLTAMLYSSRNPQETSLGKIPLTPISTGFSERL